MIINDTEFKKLCQLGFVTGIRTEEVFKKGKPVWRLDISLRDANEPAHLYTQRHRERTFSHPHTLLAYVRKNFHGDCEITFKMSKEFEAFEETEESQPA